MEYTLIALALNAMVLGSSFFFLQQTLDAFFFGLPVNPIAVILSYVFLYSVWKIIGAMLFIAIIAMAALRRYLKSP